MAGLTQTLFHALQAAGLVDIAPASLQNREYFFCAGGIFIPHIDYKTKQSNCCLATPLEWWSLSPFCNSLISKLHFLFVSVFTGWCFIRTLLELFHHQSGMAGYCCLKTGERSLAGESGKGPTARIHTAAQKWVCCRFRDANSDEIAHLGWKGLYFLAIATWLCVKNRFILDEDKCQKAKYLTPIFFKTSWVRICKLAFWSHGTNYCRVQQNAASSTVYAVKQIWKISKLFLLKEARHA